MCPDYIAANGEYLMNRQTIFGF